MKKIVVLLFIILFTLVGIQIFLNHNNLILMTNVEKGSLAEKLEIYDANSFKPMSIQHIGHAYYWPVDIIRFRISKEDYNKNKLEYEDSDVIKENEYKFKKEINENEYECVIRKIDNIKVQRKWNVFFDTALTTINIILLIIIFMLLQIIDLNIMNKFLKILQITSIVIEGLLVIITIILSIISIGKLKEIFSNQAFLFLFYLIAFNIAIKIYKLLILQHPVRKYFVANMIFTIILILFVVFTSYIYIKIALFFIKLSLSSVFLTDMEYVLFKYR